MSASKTYHVKHILVKHLYEAEDILKKLKEGVSFEELAQKFSTCPSTKNQGDLGELKLGQAVEEFEEACLLLEKNQTSQKPIRTKFGYHLIKRLK